MQNRACWCSLNQKNMFPAKIKTKMQAYVIMSNFRNIPLKMAMAEARH